MLSSKTPGLYALVIIRILRCSVRASALSKYPASIVADLVNVYMNNAETRKKAFYSNHKSSSWSLALNLRLKTYYRKLYPLICSSTFLSNQ